MNLRKIINRIGSSNLLILVSLVLIGCMPDHENDPFDQEGVKPHNQITTPGWQATQETTINLPVVTTEPDLATPTALLMTVDEVTPHDVETSPTRGEPKEKGAAPTPTPTKLTLAQDLPTPTVVGAAQTKEPLDQEAEVVTRSPLSGDALAVNLDLQGTEIVFWHAWGSGPIAENLLDIVDDFNASNQWGIAVIPLYQGRQNDLQEIIHTSHETGHRPNVTHGFPNVLAQWYVNGVIREIGEFNTLPAIGLDEAERGAYFPGILNQGILADGSQIGVPLQQSANVIFYNQTWAHELGFDEPPKTSEAFKEQACAAAVANGSDDDPANDGTGGFVHYPSAQNFASWVYAFGGDILNETKDGYNLNSAEALNVTLFLNDLRESGCSFSTKSYPNPEMASRKALLVTSSTAGIPFQAEAFAAAGNDDQWILLPFPGPNGYMAVSGFGQLIGISEKSPEEDLASWLWIKFFTSPENQAKWLNNSGYYPPRTDTIPYLEMYGSENPQWAMGLELLEVADYEPNFPVHDAVREAIQDAFFALQKADNEPAMQAILDQLQSTAEELSAQYQP